MTRPSDLPLRYKVGMVVAFVVAMALFAVAWSGFIHWLPPSIASALGFVAFGFSLGSLFGYRLGSRETTAGRLPSTTE